MEDLGKLIAELSAAEASVVGPSWQLDPGNDAFGEARRLAVEDARRRAEDYAAALGLRLGAVAWVVEPGLRPRQRSVDSTVTAMASGREALAEDLNGVTYDEMAVGASVEVGFSFGARA